MFSQSGPGFPRIDSHPTAGYQGEQEEASEAAAEEARHQEHDPDTLCKDSSRLGCGVGCGVAWYEEVAAGEAAVRARRRGVIRI